MTYVASMAAAAAAAARLRHLSTLSPSAYAASSIPPALSSDKINGSHKDMTPLMPPKRIFFLRHGQALHNPRAEVAREAGCSFEEFLQLMHEDDAYDADLTSLGEQQAKEAGSHHSVKEALQSVDMIVSSPLSRAIRTADLVHDSDKRNTNPRRVAIEHFREINGKLLNAKRRPRIELETIFPHWCFNEVPDQDKSWTEELESYPECSERGYQGLLWVMQEKEKKVLLVSHGGLLKMVMNDHPRVVLVDGRNHEQSSNDVRCVTARFGNCELRSYIISVWQSETKTDSDTHNAINGENSLEHHLPIITLEEVAIST